MKRNKKGFTLIELLAVLVVLAILALITVPIVLNIINQAREKARLRSMEGYAKAVESAVYVFEMENPNIPESSITLSNGKVTSTSDSTKVVDIQYSGSDVTGCTLNLSNNQVELSGCTIDNDTNNSNYYHYYDGQGHSSAKQSTSSSTDSTEQES